MKIKKYSPFTGRLPLLYIFLTGFVVGIAAMNFGKSTLLEETGLLDEYTLYQIKYMTVDSSAFFVFVMKKRIGSMLMLTVLATTYLGLLVCGGCMFWYGLSAGSFFTALMIRYGLKGIFLAMASLLPHYVLYVPAAVALVRWCENLNRNIYFDRYTALEDKKVVQPGQLMRFMGIAGVIVTGCILESFCNPYILLALLKIF